MDYLRRRSRFKQIKYKLKQTADRFSDDEFEALCHKELFRIIIFLIIYKLGISRCRKSRIITFSGNSSRDIVRDAGFAAGGVSGYPHGRADLSRSGKSQEYH